MTGTLSAEILERIHRQGPIRFDDFVELVLYDEERGFFTAGGEAGRAGADFITSPEVGPLFGAVMARALDSWWEELGTPDPFVVIEAGAGRGALAVSILHAAPRCAPALRYVLVERSPRLRERQREHLDLEYPANTLPTIGESEHGTIPDEHAGAGPVVTSLESLPAVRGAGIVIANELLDNLPFRLLERDPAGWREVRVGVDSAGRLCEVLVAAHPTLAGRAAQLAPDAAPGARIPFQQGAVSWLRDALGAVERGRVVAIDYAAETTAELADRPWTEWLRTYRGHQRGGHPLDDLGQQDVTCEVAVDQLAAIHRLDGDRSQAEWLAAHGVDELVDEGRRRWEAKAAAPDLAAIEARSRAVEAEALRDPAGLGAHRVLEWQVR